MSEMSAKKTENWPKITFWRITKITFWGIMCASAGMIISAMIVWDWQFPADGKPLQDTALVVGKEYIKIPHPNLFLVREIGADTPAKAYFLPSNCPDRFVIIGVGKNRRIIPVPEIPEKTTKK